MKINKERDDTYKQYFLDNFIYNPETGNVIDKTGNSVTFINRVHKYVYIKVEKNIIYAAHRIAWLLYYGEFPNQIDHINHDRTDNRIVNLRECTVSENNANALIRKDSCSGYKNVAWNYKRNKWQVRIQKDGYRKAYAFFDSIDEAIKEADRIRKELHGEFAHS